MSKEVEEKKETEITGETFLQGCYGQKHYTRSKFRCPNCRHWHVAVEDGLGRDFPTSIPAICETCGMKLIIRGWHE
jgi:predicted RNA-binding Zn-ribbon protein involved in translation (DUF1610 family)